MTEIEEEDYKMIQPKTTNTQTTNKLFLWISRWPAWIGYATAVWSLIYGLLGLYWTMDGVGFPFGEGDPVADTTILYGLQAETGAPVIAILGLVGVIVSLLMVRASGHGWIRKLLTLFGVIVFVMLALVIPDARVMIAVAYLPIAIVGAPFDFPSVSYMVAIPWPVINQFILILGGVLWLATSIVYYRQSKTACTYCGRIHGIEARWTTPNVAEKWGKWTVYVSLLIPAFYAIFRFSWALGIPLGISDQFLQELHSNGLWLAGLALASMCVIGGVLTLGLIQRWGEIFPRWIPFLANKRVPPTLAIVPATMMAVFMISCGLQAIRDAVSEGLSLSDLTHNPLLFFPLWGLALALATIAYYYRRRGQCGHCGKG